MEDGFSRNDGTFFQGTDATVGDGFSRNAGTFFQGAERQKLTKFVRKGLQLNTLQTPNVSGTVPEPYKWNPDPLAASLVRGGKNKERRTRRQERGDRRQEMRGEERGKERRMFWQGADPDGSDQPGPSPALPLLPSVLCPD